MTNNKEVVVDYQELEKTENVGLGDGHSVQVVGVGMVYLKIKFRVSKSKRCVRYRVLYVPKLACNLFSVRAAVANGKFAGTKCYIRDGNGGLLGIGSISNKMYQLHCEPVKQESRCQLQLRDQVLICGISI